MEVVSDNEIFSGYSNLALMNRAGFPPTMEFSPTSPVTTLPAATIAPSPIVTYAGQDHCIGTDPGVSADHNR